MQPIAGTKAEDLPHKGLVHKHEKANPVSCLMLMLTMA